MLHLHYKFKSGVTLTRPSQFAPVYKLNKIVRHDCDIYFISVDNIQICQFRKLCRPLAEDNNAAETF